MLAQQIRISEQRPPLYTQVILLQPRLRAIELNRWRTRSQWAPSLIDFHNQDARSTEAGRDALGIAKWATNIRQMLLWCIWECHCFKKYPPTLIFFFFLTASGVVEISNYGHLKPFKLYVIAFIPDVHALFPFANLKILALCLSQAGPHSAADPLKIVYLPLFLLSYRTGKQEMGSTAANRPWSRRSSEGQSCW